MGRVLPLKQWQDAHTNVWRGNTRSAQRVGVPTGIAALDGALPEGGWPAKGLVEILPAWDGVGELQLVMPTLAQRTQQGCAVWLIAPPYIPYLPSWQAAGVCLQHVHVVQATPVDALWAMEQALRVCKGGAVLGWPTNVNDTALRRLHAAAEHGHCLGIAMRSSQALRNPSPAVCRIEVRRNEHAQSTLRVHKCRGGFAPAHTIAWG